MAETFQLREGGPEYAYFYHRHNCGLRDAPRRTERTVELSVADAWLTAVEGRGEPPAIEIGAVSPYYWPRRLRDVVDPADRKCTIRKSLFDFDFSGRPVLCVSTIEHVGEGRYGLNEPRQPLEALQQIQSQASRFLITLPWGWEVNNPRSKSLFHFLLDGWQHERLPGKTQQLFCLTRQGDETWVPSTTLRNYGIARAPWANTVLILEGGPDLIL